MTTSLSLTHKDRYRIDCDGKAVPTYTVVYMGHENVSHHETAAEARAAIKRYSEADARRRT